MKNNYRWVFVFALAFMNIIFYGTYHSFSVFLKPLSEEFNWTRAATSGAVSVYMFMHGLVGIASGVLLDRYGPRIVLAIAGVIIGAGYLMISQITSLWQLYLYYGIMLGMGMSATWVIPGAAVTKYFGGRRGLPLGIVYAAIGTGQLSIPPLASALVARYDWRVAYAILGVAILVLALPAIMLLKPHGEAGVAKKNESAEIAPETTTGYSVSQAARTLPFWLLLSSFCLAAVPIQAIAVHTVAYAQDKGIDALAAAGIMTFFGLGAVVGRLAFGAISDRLGSKLTLMICMVIQIIGMLPLVVASSLWTFYLAVLVFGLGQGGGGPLYVALAADRFGVKSMGALVGLLSLGWSLGAAFGAPWAGFIQDTTKSYSLAFVSAIIAASLALLVLLPMRPTEKSMERSVSLAKK